MPKKNPLKLNNLQLKTLTVLQALAETDLATADAETGKVTISSLPNPHGNHFHIGDRVVLTRDATGLHNQSVWAALARKGLLAEAVFPMYLTLSTEALGYDTGLADAILHKAGH